MPCVHRTFHDVFADLREDQWPYYLPDSWVPHCTLAINIKKEEILKALDNVIRDYRPKSAEVVRVALVEYHPVKILKDYRFMMSSR